jgi:hypothetical protein
MMKNPTELEKKLYNSISKQKNNQNCHEIKINKKLPVKNKTDIKPVTSEKEGYADACTIIPQHEIMIYNVVKRVINDNKINDYNSIPLLVKSKPCQHSYCLILGISIFIWNTSAIFFISVIF